MNRELTTERIVNEIVAGIPAPDLRFHFAQCLRIHYSYLTDRDFVDQVANLYPQHVIQDSRQ